MAITHGFVSGKGDGPDGTLVQPSNWNADHTIDDGTVTPAKLDGSGGGTASSSTFYRGDGAWVTPPGGGGSGIDVLLAASDASAAAKAAADYVCTGTNDGAEITQALLDVSLSHAPGGPMGRVLLTGGTFNIESQQILMRHGTHLQGSGRQTILNSDGMAAVGLIELFDIHTGMTSVTDLTLYGNYSAGGDSHGFRYWQNSGGTGGGGSDGNLSTYDPGSQPDAAHVMTNLYVRAFTGGGGTRHGIWLGDNVRGTYGAWLRVTANSGYGVNITGASDSKFVASSASGVQGGWNVGGGSCQFTTCKSFYSDGPGWVVSSSRVHLVGCHSQDNGTHGYLVTGTDPAITGCVADSNGRLDNTNTYALELSSDGAMVEGFHAYDRNQTPGSRQINGINLVGSPSDIYLTGQVQLPSGSNFINGSPGGNSFARVVRAGTTIYSVG